MQQPWLDGLASCEIVRTEVASRRSGEGFDPGPISVLRPPAAAVVSDQVVHRKPAKVAESGSTSRRVVSVDLSDALTGSGRIWLVWRLLLISRLVGTEGQCAHDLHL
jgi:hypothetical protein